jgi:hypothetical protein
MSRQLKCEVCNLLFLADTKGPRAERSQCPKCGRPGNDMESPARRQFRARKLRESDELNRNSFVCRSLAGLPQEKLDLVTEGRAIRGQ